MKSLTSSYLKTIRKFYPNAGYASLLGDQLIAYIRTRDFKPDQVMAANSVCSDDLVSMQFAEPHSDLLGPFNMGGLNGFPFTGLTGLGAFAHHMPEKGALLIVYAPHVGISEKGELGLIIRPGQTHASDCCGASIKALKELGILPSDPEPHTKEKEKKKDKKKKPSELDDQYQYILALYRKHKKQIRDAKHPLVEATKVMYADIEKRLFLLISKSKEVLKDKHLFLAGGTFINTDDGYPACAANYKVTEIFFGAKQAETDHTNKYKKFAKQQ